MSMCERVGVSQHRPLCSLKSGGLHSFTGIRFRVPTMYNRCCLKLCLCIVYSSITSRVKGHSLKVWEDTGWYAWVNAFPPQGLELGLASFAHPFHQWIILLSHYPSALRVFDVWFDTPHQFINAVIHILKSLSSEMSKLQDHIIRNIFFLSFWMRISLALGDSLQSCWLSSTPDILSSHLPPFICE